MLEVECAAPGTSQQTAMNFARLAVAKKDVQRLRCDACCSCLSGLL